MLWSKSPAKWTCTWILALQALAFDHTPAQEPEATQTYVERLRSARDSLIAGRDFTAALEPARLIVDELESGGESSAAADRIMLAVIFAELGRFDDAEADLLSAIEALQDDEGLYSEAIVTPLRLLGRTYMRARRFPEAITALSEARTVTRRNTGLFSIDQIGVLDDLTTAHLGLGDTVAARDLQIERLETAQRQFGAEDARVIPYHVHLANYYERSRLLSNARAQYEEALAIARAHEDRDEILRVLRQTVALDLQTGSEEESLIEQLRSAVAEAPPSASAHELGLAHAVLGDAALVSEDYDRANELYARAWELVEAGGQADAAETYADPTVIRFIAPLTPVDLAARSLPYAWGTIAFDFDVDDEGRVSSINGVGAQPTGLMEKAYEERLRSAIFRPSLVDGEPEDAQGVILTHYFRYYVEPEEAED